MPLYSYQCSNVSCNNVDEVQRKIAARNRAYNCSVCGCTTRRQVVQSFMPKAWDANKLYENFDVTPIRFATENDMRRRCRADGIECGKLL